MRVCLMIEGQEDVTWEQWLALARAAENAGLDGLFRSDHYSAIIRPVGGSARRVGDPGGAGGPHVHDPARHAGLTGDLPASERARAHGDHRRPRLAADVSRSGMGAGWYDRDHAENGFPFLDVKAASTSSRSRSRSSSAPGRRRGSTTTGEHYTLRGQTALPRPVQQPHPPLILGGTATPRAAALAARFADRVQHPRRLARRAARAPAPSRRAACTACGRDPATLGYSLMTTCVIGADRAEVAERHGRVEAMLGSMRAGALVGTVDELAERLAALETAGISRVMLQHLDHADLGAVAAMGELARAVG